MELSCDDLSTCGLLCCVCHQIPGSHERVRGTTLPACVEFSCCGAISCRFCISPGRSRPVRRRGNSVCHSQQEQQLQQHNEKGEETQGGSEGAVEMISLVDSPVVKKTPERLQPQPTEVGGTLDFCPACLAPEAQYHYAFGLGRIFALLEERGSQGSVDGSRELALSASTEKRRLEEQPEFVVSPAKRLRSTVDLTSPSKNSPSPSKDLTNRLSGTPSSDALEFWSATTTGADDDRGSGKSRNDFGLTNETTLVSRHELVEFQSHRDARSVITRQAEPSSSRAHRGLSITEAAVSRLTRNDALERHDATRNPVPRRLIRNQDDQLEAHRAEGVCQASQIVDPQHRNYVKTLPDLVWCKYSFPRAPLMVALDDSEELRVNLRTNHKAALHQTGVTSLYSHQVECLNSLVADTKDVVLVTPTGSGKSNCYNVATFHMLLGNPKATALYFFPLNVLCEDQMEKLERINAALHPAQRLRICLQNGQTSADERMTDFCRDPPCRILVTNPDTFHFQLARGLRLRDGWRQHFVEFLRGLSIVVLDEAHTYTGRFGTNVANLMRRLYCAFESILGAIPRALRCVVSSATIGNAMGLATALTTRDSSNWDVIEKSGARISGRASVVVAAKDKPADAVVAHMVAWVGKGWKSLIFCNSIKQVQSTVEKYRKENRWSAQYVRAFYASMSKEAKERTISDLVSGAVRAVVTTNALEAGLDLPEIQGVILHGFPGSRMALEQRIGRCGRSGAGLAIFIPHQQRPLDVFYAEHPNLLFPIEAETESSGATEFVTESVIFDPNYQPLIRQHMACAREESNFGSHSLLMRLYGPDALATFQSLGPKLYKPELALSMRGGHVPTVKIVVGGSRRLLEEMPLSQAFLRAFPGSQFLYYNENTARPEYYKVVSMDPGCEVVVSGPVPKDFSSNLVPVIHSEISVDTTHAERTVSIAESSDSEKSFELTLRYASGTVTNSLIGYQAIDAEHWMTQMLSQGDYDPITRYNETHSYRLVAPCVEFEISHNARSFLRTRWSSMVQPCLIKQAEALGSGGEATHLRKLANHVNPAAVALHTILHQLLKIIPLSLLLSETDAMEVFDEDTSSSPTMKGYIVDTADGGTGVANALFHRFENCAAFAKQKCDDCRPCKGHHVGCGLCLFSTATHSVCSDNVTNLAGFSGDGRGLEVLARR